MWKEREAVDLVQAGTPNYDDPSSDLLPPVYAFYKKKKNNEEENKNKDNRDNDREAEEEYCRDLDRFLHRFKNQKFDTTNAVKMLYDINDMINLRVDPFNFGTLIEDSNYRNCINVFDALGDPRCGGFDHISNFDGFAYDRGYIRPAEFALDYYTTLCTPDAKLKFVKVEKVTCWQQGDIFHYVTFRARDVVEDVERVYQAIVLEYEDDPYYAAAAADKNTACAAVPDKDYGSCAAAADSAADFARYAALADVVVTSKYLLGMLRVKDPTHDHVLAIIQLKPGVTHDDLVELQVKREYEFLDD